MDLGPLCRRDDGLNNVVGLVFIIDKLLHILVSNRSICNVVHNSLVEEDAVLRYNGNVLS